MKIKRNVSFKLRAYGKNNDLFQIRLRTTFNSQRLDLKTGCQINKKSAWDEEAELVKTGYKGPKGETALSINNELRNIKDQMESTFKFSDLTEATLTEFFAYMRDSKKLRTPRKRREKEMIMTRRIWWV